MAYVPGWRADIWVVPKWEIVMVGKTGCWTFEKSHIWLEGLLRQEGQEEVAVLAGDLCVNSLGMRMKVPV